MSETSDETRRLLGQLAQRARGVSDLMAGVLSRYQQLEKLDDAALAERLQTDALGLAKLALCKRPADGEHFAEETRQIAAFAKADAGQLALAIRYVESMVAIAQRPVSLTSEDALAQTNRNWSGVVAAARDRENSESKNEDEDVAGSQKSSGD